MTLFHETLKKKSKEKKSNLATTCKRARRGK
jgi:hypothetical protein